MDTDNSVLKTWDQGKEQGYELEGVSGENKGTCVILSTNKANFLKKTTRIN